MRIKLINTLWGNRNQLISLVSVGKIAPNASHVSLSTTWSSHIVAVFHCIWKIASWWISQHMFEYNMSASFRKLSGGKRWIKKMINSILWNPLRNLMSISSLNSMRGNTNVKVNWWETDRKKVFWRSLQMRHHGASRWQPLHPHFRQILLQKIKILGRLWSNRYARIGSLRCGRLE